MVVVYLTGKAKKRAFQEGILEEDAIECVEHGKRKHIEIRNGERRYAHILPTKYGVIMAVWTYDKDGSRRVITTYIVKRR